MYSTESPKYGLGQWVRYCVSPDPANLRTNEGKIQKVLIDHGKIYYWVNSNWRPQQYIVGVVYKEV